MINII